MNAGGYPQSHRIKKGDVLKCMGNVSYEEHLTLGQHYTVIDVYEIMQGRKLITFLGDSGVECSAHLTRFHVINPEDYPSMPELNKDKPAHHPDTMALSRDELIEMLNGYADTNKLQAEQVTVLETEVHTQINHVSKLQSERDGLKEGLRMFAGLYQGLLEGMQGAPLYHPFLQRLSDTIKDIYDDSHACVREVIDE